MQTTNFAFLLKLIRNLSVKTNGYDYHYIIKKNIIFTAEIKQEYQKLLEIYRNMSNVNYYIIIPEEKFFQTIFHVFTNETTMRPNQSVVNLDDILKVIDDESDFYYNIWLNNERYISSFAPIMAVIMAQHLDTFTYGVSYPFSKKITYDILRFKE